MKKIALVGNMNNSFFPLMRFLLKEGFDVTLLLTENEHALFEPANDTFEDLNFTIKSTKLSVLPGGYWKLTKKYISELLKPYDVIIGCGPVPAYCALINRPLDLFIPYGSDIYFLPFRPILTKTGFKDMITHAYFRYYQRMGILKARKVLMDYTNKDYEDLFKSLKINTKRLYNSPPFIFSPEYNPISIVEAYPKSKWYPKFKELRNSNDLVLFHHSRQEWDDQDTVHVKRNEHTKGNYKLIRAFAEFLKNTSLKAHLIMFEYGSSVQKSKELVTLLGLNDNVTWMPKMSRKEIIVGISLCDIGIGELDSSYFSYGAIYEFIAMAKPVIHYREDALYKDYYTSMYPMYAANSEEQVLQYFKKYEANPESFKETGRKSFEWFNTNAVDKPLKAIKEIITNR